MSGAGAASVVVGCCYGVVVAVPLVEAAWLAVAGRLDTRSWRRAALMGAGSLVPSAAFSMLLAAACSVAPAPGALERLWTTRPWLAAVVAFLAWDAAGYAYHWLGHRTSVGWASHRAHHSSTRYDLSLAWRQTWLPLCAPVAFLPVALLGMPFELLAVTSALSNAYQALLHTAAPVRLPRLVSALVMTPGSHRRHHASAPPVANLGPVLTCWDHLCGTWDPVPAAADAEFGSGPGRDAGVFAVQSAGWWGLLRTWRRRIRASSDAPTPSPARAAPSRV